MPESTNQLVGITLATSWQPTPIIMPKLHPKYSEFTNMKFLGTVPTGCNLKHKLPYIRDFSMYNQYLGSNERKMISEVAGDKFYLSVPNLENVEFSISTFENRPPVNFRDIFHQRALSYLDVSYRSICVDPISTSEEITTYIDYSRSCGYPANHFGYKNKRELMLDRQFQSWFHAGHHLREIPIWSVCPKEEFKDKQDLINNKIRLFTIPPYPLLYEQLRFGKKISERLKNFKWSAYGFNPYSGGAHRLAQRLLLKRIRLFYDVSGWDKYFPLLSDVFDFIRHNSIIPDFLIPNFQWMCENTMKYVFKTPHGTVFEKDYGNPSGSGTTTRDNILGHVIILASALIECYYIKYGVYPEMSLISEQIIYLFGDDSVISLDEEFDHILSDGYLASHMAKYGLKLKFLYGGLDYPIEQMQFLGFTFKKIGDYYYPLYDVQKLFTSILYKNGRNDSREAYTSRLFIIMLMSYPDQQNYKIAQRAYQNWCKYLTTHHESLTPTEISYIEMGSLQDSDIQNMFLGLESSSIRDDLYFFASQRLEEAIKDGPSRY